MTWLSPDAKPHLRPRARARHGVHAARLPKEDAFHARVSPSPTWHQTSSGVRARHGVRASREPFRAHPTRVSPSPPRRHCTQSAGAGALVRHGVRQTRLLPMCMSPSPPSEPDSREYNQRLRSARARVAALSQVHQRLVARVAFFETARTPYAARIVRVTWVQAASVARRMTEARAELVRLTTARRTCGARCRDGHPCRAPGLGRGGRCRRHGGASTGPTSPEGRARSLAALRRRRVAA